MNVTDIIICNIFYELLQNNNNSWWTILWVVFFFFWSRKFNFPENCKKRSVYIWDTVTLGEYPFIIQVTRGGFRETNITIIAVERVYSRTTISRCATRFIHCDVIYSALYAGGYFSYKLYDHICTHKIKMIIITISVTDGII